jgi:hypothetical protein
MPRAARTFAPLLAGLVLWTGAPALAQDAPAQGDPRDLIVLSGDVAVRRGDDVGEVIVLHGTASVSGVVHGDVVVIDGSISVTGQVSGSVIGINGPVTIGPDAQILGDVIARDRVRIAPGARIGGEVREGAAFTFRTPIDVFGPFAAWLAVAISTLLLGALLLLFGPRGAEAIAQAALGSPWASTGIGLVAFLGLPILGLFALVSLVALPFGLGLLLALAFLWSAGLAWTAFAIGRAIWRAPRSGWLALVLGWAVVAAFLAIPVAGGVVWFAGAVFGLGAMTVAVWRTRGAGGRHRPSAKMPPERVVAVPERVGAPEPMVTERAIEQEGTGI